MRRTTRKDNRKRRQTPVGISLFPFLAVLVCTMGVLVVLLLVFARQAQLQAAETAEVEVAKHDDELKIERELTQWRTEQIQESLRKTHEQLAEARLNLGHFEDHARRLRSQLAELDAAHRQLDQGDAQQQRSRLEAELQQVQTQLADARRRLAEAQQAAAAQPPSYAVVPYEGPHDTHRRPIYVECRADAVVLQPEGIVLHEDDFTGPEGPGNPLAAAIRAAHESLLTPAGADRSRASEPYPLLLVRPSGAAAYYAARDALASWGSDFGYELIGEDWRLDFGAADPELARAMQTAIDVARVRQQALVAAAPSRYGRSEPTWYRATPTRGGVVPADGGSGRDDSPHAEVARSGMARSGSAQEGSVGEGGLPDSRPLSPGGGQTDHLAAGGRSGSDATGGIETAYRADAAGQRNSFGQFGERPSGESQPGEWRPGEWRPGRDSPGGSPADAPSPATSTRPRAESLAKQRGRDWGLPDATRGSVPIGRPIRIECYRDRLVIVPERGTGRSRSVPLRTETRESIDELVSAVWEHIESWGIAGNGMYWRPILSVEVASDAERRYADLDALLEGSGLQVERRR